MTVTVEPMTAQELTRFDLAAMRMAREASLHLHKNPTAGDVASMLRLYTPETRDPEHDGHGFYTVRQQRLFADETFVDRRARDIAVTASAFGYGEHDGSSGWRWDPTRDDPPSCFYSMYDGASWTTIARSLRVGDRLHLEWVADNNNSCSREFGLHVDEVHLRATHAKGNAPDTWHLGWAIGPDNSARMIRH